MVLKVIERPVWHYLLLLIFTLSAIFSLIDLIILSIIEIWKIDIIFFDIFIYTSVIIIFLFIFISYFLWTHYVNVKPSVLKLYEWNDGPWLSYIEDPKTSIVINWITKNSEKTEILFGKDAKNMGIISGIDGKIHRIVLNDLIPGEIYYYKILNLPNDNKTHSFTTAPEQMKPFSFVVLGDTQNGGGFGDKNWAYPHLINEIKNHKIDLLMNLGDACDQGNDIRSWHKFLEETSKLASEIPLHVAVGNHDTGTQYLQDKNIKKYPDEGANFDYILGYNYERPANENRITSFKSRYYSFDYSNCRFLFLDSQNSKLARENNSQWKFIENKLKNCPKNMWKIVFIHRTLFEMQRDKNGEDKLIQTKYGKILVPLLEKYNVNIVFSGHKHNFQFVRRDSNSNVTQYYYIVSGGGGNELRRNPPIKISEKISTNLKYFEDSSHFIKINVNNDVIDLKVHYEDGTLMDNQDYHIQLQT